MIVVAAALVDANGKVLVQQRPAGTNVAGLWEFPGGKIEARETPEAALIRELHEELGIAVTELAPLAFASEALEADHLILLLYSCAKWSGEPQPLHASAIKWIDPAALHGLPMPNADRPLIGSIEAFVQNRRQ